jgi:hypothetical protein
MHNIAQILHMSPEDFNLKEKNHRWFFQPAKAAFGGRVAATTGGIKW